MNRRRTLVALTTFACAMVAQAQSTTGAVRGLVSGKNDTFISGARVSVRNLETGYTRSVQTGDLGDYSVTLLPVGPYEVTITAKGMRTAKDSHVMVHLGESAILNFDLEPAVEAAAVVEVVAEAQQLDTQQVSTVTSVDEKLVEAIPLATRDFTTLTALTPGAVYDSTNNRVSVEGARGIMNNLTIDGASYQSNFFGEQRGSTRIPFAFGADTIKELQVISNAYDAQFGNAAGAVINAVTKSGTNDFSGSALFQVRPKSLVAKIRDVPYDKNGTINTDQAKTKNFSQWVGNVNVGGPIIKDKLHYYVGIETYRYKEDFTPSFGVGGANTQAALNTFLGTFGNLVVGDGGRTLAQESGRAYTNDRNNTVYFGRLDWTLNESHRLTLRVNAQDWKSENGTTSFQSSFAATTGQSQQGLEKNSGLSWVVEWNAIFGSEMVNEARLQRAIERRPRYANTTAAPEFQVNGGFTAGQNNFLPNGLDEFTWQLIDNLTWSHGDWTLKGGVDLQWFDFANTFFRYQNGSFQFGNYGAASAWASGTPATNTNITYIGSQSDFGGTIAYSSKLWAGYVQAQYTGLFSHRLNLTAGLRVTKESQPDNPRPNAQFAGLDQANSSTSVDPRLGFTLSLDSKSTWLLRGGYGHFSSPNPSLTVSNTMNSNGRTTSTYTIRNGVATNALFTGPNGVLSYNQRVSNGGTMLSRVDPSQLSGLTTAGRTGQVWDPQNDLPMAKRASLALEHDFGKGLTVGMEAVHVKYENLQYFVNINLSQQGGGIYNDGYPTKTNVFSTAGRPGTAIVRGRTLDFTGFGDVFLSENNGEGKYDALILKASKRSESGWGFTGNVTWSKARDNNSNERTTASNTADSNTNNPADPLSTFSYSDNDRRWHVVFATYFPVYWGIQGSVLYSWTTGAPYSAVAGNDLNQDFGRNDYVIGTQRNQFRQPSVRQFDLRLSRDFKFGKRMGIEAFADVYNVFNWANQRTSLNTGQPNSSFFADFGYINVPDRNTREVQLGARFRF